MKFSMTRPVKIVMLGTGGTGGHIAPQLYRLLYSLKRPVRFILCDGDVVEEKNLVRQNFTPADLSGMIRKSSIPVLNAVLVRFEADRCTLTSTNIDTYLSMDLPAQGDGAVQKGTVREHESQRRLLWSHHH